MKWIICAIFLGFHDWDEDTLADQGQRFCKRCGELQQRYNLPWPGDSWWEFIGYRKLEDALRK